MQLPRLIPILAAAVLFSPISFPWSLPQSDKPAADASDEDEPEDYAELQENLLGFEVFHPQHAGTQEILGVVRELTNTKVRYVSPSRFGKSRLDSRDRFVTIGDGIGVQDFDAGRRQALQLLRRVDDMLGEQRKDDDASEEQWVTLTYTSRSLGSQGIRSLLEELPADVVLSTIPDSNVTLLTGTQAELDRVLALLATVDKPAPQFLLTCWLLQSGDAQGTDVPEELARGISTLLPGASYTVIARSVVRGSVSSQAKLALETLLTRSSSPNIPPPSFFFEARPQVYDTESGTLALKNCSFDFRAPLTQTAVAAGGTTVSNFSGYASERLVTDLTLARNEYAVVGALGAEQKLIVLRFEVLD